MAKFYDNLRKMTNMIRKGQETMSKAANASRESEDQSRPGRASFNPNLRSINLAPSNIRGPESEFSPNTLVENFEDVAGEVGQMKQEIDRKTKETAPLRAAIEEASDGKVMVDNSIYDEEELNRILNTVQKMKKYNNGVLFPGYTVISNTDHFDDSSTTYGEFYSGDYLNGYGFASFPNGLYGTKNNPYRISIKDANYTGLNDLMYADDVSDGWHPKTGKETQSEVHTHEMAHSAHRDAQKKSHPPTLWMSSEEDEAYKNLINKFSSFKELVENFTDKYNLKNTKNTANSVSGYAASAHGKDSTRKDFPYAEMFAEAYTDVLDNGKSARPVSKALVKSYSEYLNEYKKIFDSDINRTRRQFLNNNNFIENLRRSTPKLNSGRYIVK